MRQDSGFLSDWLGATNGGFTNNGANLSPFIDSSWHVQADLNENLNHTGSGVGTQWRDEMHGTGGNETFFGGRGDDIFYSTNAGRDTIHGGFGNDVINSYVSNFNHILYGDAGADVFHFELYASGGVTGYRAANYTSATIMDFQSGVDRIDLNLIAIHTSDHNLHWLGAGEFTGTNQLEVRFGNGILQVDFDGDRVPDLTIGVIGAVLPNDITYTFDPWGY